MNYALIGLQWPALLSANPSVFDMGTLVTASKVGTVSHDHLPTLLARISECSGAWFESSTLPSLPR